MPSVYARFRSVARARRPDADVGSVAAMVLRSTDLPVLLYRPHASAAADAYNMAARVQTIDIEE
jgi:hypothetical protein